jgi:hypothetical protein
MSSTEYIIDGYSIVDTQSGWHVFREDEWIGMKDTREDAVSWIYFLRREAKRMAGR